MISTVRTAPPPRTEVTATRRNRYLAVTNEIAPRLRQSPDEPAAQPKRSGDRQQRQPASIPPASRTCARVQACRHSASSQPQSPPSSLACQSAGMRLQACLRNRELLRPAGACLPAIWPRSDAGGPACRRARAYVCEAGRHLAAVVGIRQSQRTAGQPACQQQATASPPVDRRRQGVGAPRGVLALYLLPSPPDFLACGPLDIGPAVLAEGRRWRRRAGCRPLAEGWTAGWGLGRHWLAPATKIAQRGAEGRQWAFLRGRIWRSWAVDRVDMFGWTSGGHRPPRCPVGCPAGDRSGVAWP